MALLESTLAKVVVALLAVTAVGTVGVGTAFATGAVSIEQPTVENIESSWGEVTNETTRIRTRVTIDNPNPVGVPAIVRIDYELRMNGVTVATGRKGGIGLSQGPSTIELVTEIDNTKIPAWWISHVGRGEETVISFRPTVSATPLFSRELPAQKQTFETDFLGALSTDEAESLTLGDRTVLAVDGIDARWGETTETSTPVLLSMRVTNPSDAPLSFGRLGATVRMNDIVVAEGTTDGEVEIAPGSTETIGLSLDLEADRLQGWWVSHIEGGERTRLDVEVFAVTERDGESREVPLPFLSPTIRLGTDILGSGEANVERLDSGADFDFRPPTITSAVTAAEAVDDETSRIAVRATVDNPNPPNSTLAELLRLDVGYLVEMNDVTIANATAEGLELSPGENEIEAADTVPEGRIRAWWVSHINNGERSTMAVRPRVVADVGVVALPVEIPESRSEVTTDILGDVGGGGAQTATIAGQPVVSIGETEAGWGEATDEVTPVDVSVTAENLASEPIEITEIGYTVEMNDVVMADGATSETIRIDPGETERVTATANLDNSKLGEWWVSHIRNGERTRLSMSWYVVVEYRGESRRVGLDGLGGNSTFETSLFGPVALG